MWREFHSGSFVLIINKRGHLQGVVSRFIIVSREPQDEDRYLIAVAHLFEFPEKQLRTIIFC